MPSVKHPPKGMPPKGKMPPGMHKMPGGGMMGDEQMEKTHKAKSKY